MRFALRIPGDSANAFAPREFQVTRTRTRTRPRTRTVTPDPTADPNPNPSPNPNQVTPSSGAVLPQGKQKLQLDFISYTLRNEP
jgi:hypothetical protein